MPDTARPTFHDDAERPSGPPATAEADLADEMHRAALWLHRERDAALYLRFEDAKIVFMLIKQRLGVPEREAVSLPGVTK